MTSLYFFRSTTLRSLLVPLFTLLLIVSPGCRRDSHNGEIDGYWQITAVENLATGEVTHPQDRYMSFNLEIVQLNTTEFQPWYNSYITGRLYVADKGHKITTDFSVLSENSSNARKAVMEQCGIFRPITVFQASYPDCNHLKLTSEDAIISARRW